MPNRRRFKQIVASAYFALAWFFAGFFPYSALYYTGDYRLIVLALYLLVFAAGFAGFIHLVGKYQKPYTWEDWLIGLGTGVLFLVFGYVLAYYAPMR